MQPKPHHTCLQPGQPNWHSKFMHVYVFFILLYTVGVKLSNYLKTKFFNIQQSTISFIFQKFVGMFYSFNHSVFSTKKKFLKLCPTFSLHSDFRLWNTSSSFFCIYFASLMRYDYVYGVQLLYKFRGGTMTTNAINDVDERMWMIQPVTFINVYRKKN